jgi:hypothetical protein
MDLNLPATLSLLASTPAALNGLLRTLPESWTQANEGPGTWTAQDVVRHLIKMEHVNWLPRIRYLLQHGERQVFPPMDREPGRNPAQPVTLASLLDSFAEIRARRLDELRQMDLQPAQLLLRGTHPTFGAVTLSQLLATWAVHDLTHLHQVSRILAHQYKDAVGPWIAYLGVLQCDGHSTND